MRMKLTEAAVRRLPTPIAGSRYEVTDLAMPGLTVRVGARTKAFYYRSGAGGKTRTVRIGGSPSTTLEQARAAVIQLQAGNQPASIHTKQDGPKCAERSVPTLSEAFSEYCRLRKLRDSTLATYRKQFRLYLPSLAELPVTHITADDVLAIYKGLLVEKSAAKANGVLGLLKAVLKFISAVHKLPVTDISSMIKATGVKEPTPARRRLIREEQAAKWYHGICAMPPHYRAPILTAALTGLRISEITGLKWADVDFTEGLLTVRKTKNGRDHTLPFGSFLGALLREWRGTETQYPNDCVFHPRADRFFWLTKQRIGIDFSPHDLRRTFATQATRLDINAFVLKALLNHQSRSDVTQSSYVHLEPSDLRKAMTQIEHNLLSLWGVTSDTPA